MPKKFNEICDEVGVTWEICKACGLNCENSLCKASVKEVKK